jgi:dTDP-4-amino-4,6-dideoxygalactose transaminase
MERVMKIAKKYDLFVVEDAALAIGTYFKEVHAGLHGDVGCFSFYPVKHMTTAEGGMLITKNEEIASKIMRQRAFGVDRHVGERKVPGVYDVTMLGYNYRMNEIQAVLGIEQLKRLDGFLKLRKANYETLKEGLESVHEIQLLKSSYEEYQSSYYCLSIILKDQLSSKRFEVANLLKSKGIGTSVYYPKAVPHLSYYQNKYGYSETSYPVASKISKNSIALPVGPHLSHEDMVDIIAAVKDTIQEVK